METEGGGTLENPAAAGAEGAKRMLNLSGERTERCLPQFAVLFAAARTAIRSCSTWAALFCFPGIEQFWEKDG